ncbi:methyltransferase domain-containing protein [Variovorax sp. GB1P17]|uniref:methyltransferase domain-containing protein n=1 Tax=Variovorax sp. GB1P17 TaxID=3443740 RepID=UPI003F465D60
MPHAHETLSETVQRLSQDRFTRFGSLPLQGFQAARERFVRLDPQATRLLQMKRGEMLDLLDDEDMREEWISDHARRLGEVAYRHNQFLSPADLDSSPAAPIYRELLARLRVTLAAPSSLMHLDQALQPLLTAHHAALWRWSTSLLAERFGDSLAQPVCSEYRAELQLKVLGIDVRQLAEPILDLGCGEGAHLVRHLRALGLDARGIDRLAAPDHAVWQGDWLDADAPLQPQSWSTVISHMAFSNHFHHQHLRRDGSAATYAARYMKVLEALRPGGRFFYAPSLPFFEALLPQQRYRVARRPVVGSAMEATEMLRRT